MAGVARSHRREIPDPARILGVVVATVVTFGVVPVLLMPPATGADDYLEPQVAIPWRGMIWDCTGLCRGRQIHGIPPIHDDLPYQPPLDRHPDASQMGKGPMEGPLAPRSNDLETRLAPIDSPAPAYPIEALREGVAGTVQLELLVGTHGRVLDARILQSSGDRRLDAAARDQVLRNWRFRPAMKDGAPVQGLARVPIVFTLDGK
jgi:TonB family protein